MFTSNSLERDRNQSFSLVCNDIESKIQVRLNAHALLLQTGSAYFSTADTITRADWRNFYESIRIKRYLPGIQGLGFAQIIPKDQRKKHIQHIRNEGFPDYTVRPEYERDTITSIVFLEPLAGRNLRAFGYDMFSEPVRRKAMQQSRDLDLAMLSGRVTLVQETNKDVQAGTLMYVPVYKKGMPVNTVTQRRKAILGWVYSPYRMNNLMQGILGRWDDKLPGRIRLRVYDENKISAESLLFDSQTRDHSADNAVTKASVVIPVKFNGTNWTLVFTQVNIKSVYLQGKVLFVLVSGLIISLLLFSLSLSLFDTLFTARHIAGELTSELKLEKERFQMLLNSSAEAIYGLDLNGNCTFANVACLQILGYQSAEQLIGKDMHKLIHHSHSDGSYFDVFECRIFQAFQKGEGIHVDDEVLWRADKSSFPAEYWSYPIFVNGKISGAVVSFVDISERRRAEMLLRESEARFKNMFTHHSSIMLLIDADAGQIMDANDAAELFYGYTREQLCSMNINEINILGSEQVAEERLKAKNHHKNDFVFSHRLANGEERIVEVHSSPIEFENKIILFSIIHDITGRKVMEETNRLRESYLTAIIENQPGLLWLKDRDGSFLAVNEAFAISCGLSNKELLVGKTDWDIWPKELANQYVNDDRKVMESRKSKIVEELIADKGLNKWFETFKTPILNNDGEVIGTTGFSRDITERKQAEETIKQVTARLKLATSVGGIGVWDYDVENGSLVWDAQMFNLYGIKSANFPGAYEAWLNGVHPSDRERGNAEIQMAIRGEKEFNTEFRVVWPDGSIHHIRALSIVQRDETGKALHMIGTNWDITEQKRNEEALIRAKLEAEMANKAKSEFLANMSHEIRTPMNAILGFSEALYYKLESKQHQKMVKSVVSSGNLLLSLLNDILDLSKIEAGKLEINYQPADLTASLQELTSLFAEKATSKGIALNCQFSPDFPQSLIIDELRVRQILFNLIGNAIKFTHEGKVETRLIFIPNSESSGSLQIEVEDTGIGIREDQQEIIFEAFRQQSGQSNRAYGGTGLGLAITKRLVEIMNGTITLKSAEGKGSMFTVLFPDVKMSDLRIQRDRLDDFENMVFEPASVLVVDDVISNIEAIENLLSTTNLNVISANSGELALEILKNSQPSVIMLDMRMPGIDGYEVANRIKSNPLTKHIPVIAFTASVFNSTQIESSGNFDGYLYKPVKRSDLLAQLAKHIKYKVEPAFEAVSKWDLADIPESLHEKLPEILEMLNQKFIPTWLTIKDSLVIYQIEQFAVDLRKLAEEYQFDGLKNYACQILENIESLDLEQLKTTVKQFSEIIEKIEQMKNKPFDEY